MPTKTTHALTIGQLAKLAGVGVETIRFYEREGLLPTPRRTKSGYRQYEDDAALRLRFIQHAQELGFSLREVRELLSLKVTVGADCGVVKARALQKVADMEDKIAILVRMRETLLRLADGCTGHGPVTACTILEALEA